MGAQITYTDTLPRFYDTKKITLEKILQKTNAGGGGGGGGGGTTDTFAGAGAPGAGTGVSGNMYWDTTNKDLYVKDGSTWTLVVDLV